MPDWAGDKERDSKGPVAARGMLSFGEKRDQVMEVSSQKRGRVYTR